MTRLFTLVWATIARHRAAFIAMNVVFFGIFVVGMAVTMWFPGLKQFALDRYDLLSLNLPFFDFAVAGYTSGNVWRAAAGTFVINLGVAALLTTIPSLIVPFIGIVPVFYRVLLWGPMFAPFGIEAQIFIPHTPTVLVEGFAYLLAAFAAYVHGMMIVNPRAHGFGDRWQAYRGGLPMVGAIFLVAVIILAFAALYEAYEVIHLVPLFLKPSA